MSTVIWHDLECGSYTEDLPLWRAFADECGGPILEVGAGTGRVALELARGGHEVTALDLDGELLAALEQRGAGLDVRTTRADARAFELDGGFALCLVPMQTIQLLGGPPGGPSSCAGAGAPARRRDPGGGTRRRNGAVRGRAGASGAAPGHL